MTDVQYDIDRPGRIMIAFAVMERIGGPEQETRTIVLDGEEAQAVLAWLGVGAIDVMEQYRERVHQDETK